MLLQYTSSHFISTWLENSWYDGQTRVYTNIENEPLKAGDVIFYYDPIFVAGSHQGERTSTILRVDMSRDLVLLLDNGNALPLSQYVKR
jgi:hypothetical protein